MNNQQEIAKRQRTKEINKKHLVFFEFVKKKNFDSIIGRPPVPFRIGKRNINYQEQN